MTTPTVPLSPVTSLIVGILALVALYIIYLLLTGKGKISEIYIGAAGIPSATKLQWFLWTAVAIFAYVAMYVARVQKNDITAISEIPVNLLLAMGISIGTNIGSRAIQSAQTASGQKKTGQSKAKSIFDDEDGNPDLSRVQMLAWTFIAIGVYIVHLLQQIQFGPYNTLPDIDASLMVLMGLGQGAFLGKQLITSNNPIINRLTPSHGKPGDSITIDGRSFGDDNSLGMLYFDIPGQTVDADEWKDKTIKFTLPTENPKTSAPWADGDKVNVNVSVGGRQALNPQLLTIDFPKITSMTLMTGKPGDSITITGRSLGNEAGVVYFDDNSQPVPVDQWKDESIKFKIPAQRPKTNAVWNDGDKVTVYVTTAESRQALNPQLLSITVKP